MATRNGSISLQLGDALSGRSCDLLADKEGGVPMWEQAGETWQFKVSCGPAERVYLVKESLDGVSTWLEMRRLDADRWELTDQLTKGQYRFRYYTVEGSVFINGGTTGLHARRLTGEDSGVHVEALQAAANVPVS